ncbi:16S rRNA (guanine(527)-N(7))-methyltransferase RsmG [Helicobacter sp. faydin-H17]|nr:16S rRNA (guanine(527)-N(7))-methyltransferase RsmG [Helicobacter kayseriensis]MCE3047004.1 16S rRNA (guanine(527)-N(7))-methyltransferase RsmG [Helicobacter kayseriensis]
MSMHIQLQHYATLLLKWNQTHNLSGAKTLQEIQDNIQDCLYPLDFVTPFESVIDIGSGCGFPAIPLAIACPKSIFYLTEPRKKRASFLQMLAFELELKNIQIFPHRLEDTQLPQVDLITSRAVASTPSLIKISKHLLSPMGAFLFYKGSNLLYEGEEIKDHEIFTSPHRQIYFYRRNQC